MTTPFYVAMPQAKAYISSLFIEHCVLAISSLYWCYAYLCYLFVLFRYYLKVNEPDGRASLVSINQSANYTFKSGGQGSIQLGLKHNNGWLQTDQTSFVVLGPINGLELLLDGSTADPFSNTENSFTEFRLRTSVQPFQIKKYVSLEYMF